MCIKLCSSNKDRDLVTNDIHPKNEKYQPVQHLCTCTFTKFVFLLIVAVLFVEFWGRSLVERVNRGIDGPPSAVRTTNYVINEPATGVFEKHQLPRIVEGFCNGTMKNDDNIPVDVRDLIIGFIREQFHLEWRGTYLFAVHPNPIDFDRTDMSYEFVARIDGRKEIRMRHQENIFKHYWKSSDKPEMNFCKHGAQGSKSQDSADHWTSVTLKVSHLDAKREWKTWDITTVDVPNFHETLQDKLRDDLHLPELVIPKNKFNVQEYGGVKYFDLSARHLSMTRFYCDSEGGGSYEVVQSDNPRDQLPEEAVSDPAFALTLAYAKDSDKWREFFGVKFVKADPSSLV
eukprot:390494_1